MTTTGLRAKNDGLTCEPSLTMDVGMSTIVATAQNAISSRCDRHRLPATWAQVATDIFAHSR